MVEETINKTADIPNLSFEREKRDKIMLVLLLLFVMISLALDYTFTIPKITFLKKTMSFCYVAVFLSAMLLIANRVLKDCVPELKVFFKKESAILKAIVIVTAILLALHIRTGGGIIRSPYVSFLSSFPIVCMVLLFETVTLLTCIKGASIVLLALILVYFTNPVVKYIFGKELFADTEELNKFIESNDFVYLTICIIIITVIANLLSIYFSSRKQIGEN